MKQTLVSSKKKSLVSTGRGAGYWSVWHGRLLSSSRQIFLRHIRWFSIAILIAAAVVCIMTINSFLFSASKAGESANLPARERLKTAAIDYLEFWIEERHGNYQRPLTVPAGVFSKTN